MNISESQLRALLVEVGELAVLRTLTAMGLTKDSISKREAEKRYGHERIKTWIKEGIIKPQRDEWGNHQFHISVIECETASKANNRNKFITV
jgi:hypothetical protein